MHGSDAIRSLVHANAIAATCTGSHIIVIATQHRTLKVNGTTTIVESELES